jgi:hypothetical protein
MNKKPFYATRIKPAPIKTIEPDANTPQGMLLAAAEALHGAPEELTPEAQAISRSLIDGVLGAAGAARYAKSDLLATMLANCEITPRTLVMAHQACDAVDFDVLQDIFTTAGLHSVIDWSLS